MGNEGLAARLPLVDVLDKAHDGLEKQQQDHHDQPDDRVRVAGRMRFDALVDAQTRSDDRQRQREQLQRGMKPRHRPRSLHEMKRHGRRREQDHECRRHHVPMGHQGGRRSSIEAWNPRGFDPVRLHDQACQGGVALAVEIMLVEFFVHIIRVQRRAVLSSEDPRRTISSVEEPAFPVVAVVALYGGDHVTVSRPTWFGDGSLRMRIEFRLRVALSHTRRQRGVVVG